MARATTRRPAPSTACTWITCLARSDPAGLLEGTGKYMRHVKVRPGLALDELSLKALIAAAYRHIVARLKVAE